MRTFHKLILLTLLLTSNVILSTSLVYNMKIRRIFSGLDKLLDQDRNLVYIPTVVPILYWRDRHIIDPSRNINVCEDVFLYGTIFDISAITNRSWWFEATTAIEHERSCLKGSANFEASRTGFDDIVISAGRNYFIDKAAQISIYGLAGFPTRTKVAIFDAHDPLVGTRFFSLGIGFEFSYSFFFSLEQSLLAIFQSRLLHFFSRDWEPIIPCPGGIQPGNVTDLLFALKYRKRKHVFEAGFNPTFFSNNALFLPFNEKTEGVTFVRHSVYASYEYIFVEFPIIKMPVILGGGFLVSRAKQFDTKIFALYLDVSVVF